MLKNQEANEIFLRKISKICLKEKMNLSKVNRLRMSQVGDYLDQLEEKFGLKFVQNFKIIFLIKDQRGIVSSRRKRRFSKGPFRNAKKYVAIWRKI